MRGELLRGNNTDNRLVLRLAFFLPESLRFQEEDLPTSRGEDVEALLLSLCGRYGVVYGRDRRGG